MEKRSIQSPTVLSLFSGIGGLDLGFEKAGFNIVATVELNEDCCETVRQNRDVFFSPQTKIINGDITKIEPEQIYDGEIDFFIGGPPCQTFSAIGRRAGGASGRLDDRGNLFTHYCRLLKFYNPIGFLFENVRGILSSNKGQDWEDILKEFSSLGYKLKFRVLDTAGFGVAQHRERVILVGYKGENEFAFPRPTHGPDSKNKRPFVSAKESLYGVNHTEPIEKLFNDKGKYDNLLAAIPPGLNYLYYTEEMGHPKPQFAWRSKFSDFLYKADPDQPVKTIVASMGKYSGPFHWDNRKLSIGELLRLQGFPDGYKLYGGRTSQIKQIGNSVAPLFAFPLALAVKKTVFNDKTVDVELLNDEVVLSNDKRKSLKAKNTRGKRFKQETTQISLFDIDDANKNEAINQSKQLENTTFSFHYNSPSNLEIYKELVPEAEFKIYLSLNNDKLKVNLSSLTTCEKPQVLQLDLSINTNSTGPIKSIVLSSNWFDPSRPYVIWDAVNVVISNICHFPSIYELYGHFTEPKPKFTIEQFKLPQNESPITLLLDWMSRVQNTFSAHPLNILEKMGFSIGDETKLLHDLRSKRIDLRTNKTNNRIDKGKFRICYPFTLPIDRKTFVTIR